MRYIFLIALFLAPTSIVTAAEAETWKCKIKETMGIKKGGGALRPTRFVDEDYEYRILSLAALIDFVGVDTLRQWQMESEGNPLPLEPGDYFYRSTEVAGKDRWDWTELHGWLRSDYQYRGDHAWFNTETARFETHPVMLGGWTSGDEDDDYVFEFAECAKFYD